MIPKLIYCPACGSHETEPAIGDGQVCLHCGHLFQVVNNRAQDFEEDEDDDTPDPAA